MIGIISLVFDYNRLIQTLYFSELADIALANENNMGNIETLADCIALQIRLEMLDKPSTCLIKGLCQHHSEHNYSYLQLKGMPQRFFRIISI